MALCCYCMNPDFRTDNWIDMRTHYKENHPEVKRPDKLYEKDWRNSLGRWAK